MADKLLTASNGVVPEPPPPFEWRRAPYLQNGDRFWDKVTTHLDDFNSNPPTNTDTDTKPLLLEPEMEVGETTADDFPASSIPRLLIERGDFPYSLVEYTHATPTLQSDWLIWSIHILSSKGYCDILRRANILQSVCLDPASLDVLLSRWSCETHTFVAAWGEFAPSLEDVYVLFRLPVLGSADSDLSVVSEEEREIVDALRSAATEAAQRGSSSVHLDSPPPCSSKCPTYSQWYRHFFRNYEPASNGIEIGSAQHPRRSVTGPEYGKSYELAAFLSYWLDQFIFEGKPEDGINERVFPLAAALSCGRALPLAPMFLGTLYYRLDMLKEDWARSLGRYEVTTYVSCSFLTLFLYERFPLYAPKTLCIKTEKDQCQDYSRAMKWTCLMTSRNLADYIDGFENFCARPYVFEQNGIVCGGAEDVVTVLKDDFNISTLIFIAIVSQRALPYITETGEGAIAYNPYRIARQFGYDQGVPGITNCQGSYTSSCELAVHQCSSFTIPSGKREGRYTLRFRKYWASILKKLFAFPSGSPQPLEPVPILEDDISLKAPKKRPDVTAGGLSRFAKAMTTATASASQKTYQGHRYATSCGKRQPPLINLRPCKSMKSMRTLSKTNSDFGSSLDHGADEDPVSPPVSPSRLEVDEFTDTANITNKSPSESEQQVRSAESQRLRLLDDILRSQLVVCHDSIPVAWLLSPSGSRQLFKLCADYEKRDISVTKGVYANDVVEKEVASPNPVEIRDGADGRHLNSEDIKLNLPEAESIDVASASVSSSGSSVAKTSLSLPLPPPREENIGPDELVQWQGYKCSFRSISYLDCISHKHRKTFDNFRVKSAHFQGMFLDALASLIKSLAGKRFSQITIDEINVARDLMMDWKSSAGLDLSWLEQRYADANARLAVHGLNQESAHILLELQQTDKKVTDLRHDLAVEEAKAASLRARCDELAQNLSSQQAIIDPTLSFEDEILKDLLIDRSHPENFPILTSQ
ncbi:uncharacterized protein LOC132315694 [Cornus florida]|uniref:uncharacterized protein LOC132315694 n=1 Tax=Cornus florida TaxID=4283 RepID=UPI0028996377|nr:uncharacterized protein LOC132315694 [Cornus florida]